MKNLSPAKKNILFIIILAVICVGICSFNGYYSFKNTTAALAADNLYKTDNPDAPAVYMTSEITPEALVEIYDKLGFNAEGNVAVKMSTGEPPNSNYLRPELIGDLVKKVDGTIVECNTAYGGSRASTAMHEQVIKDHGLDVISKNGVADIMDAESSMTIPVPAPKGGTSTITEDYVGAHLANYDSLISLAHFKGHGMAGYGGAIKNMSIGVASSRGKNWIHSGGNSSGSMWGGSQDAFLEAMGDATSAVIDYMDGKVVYINVMNRLSVDCDCDGNPAEPDMHDIGILASYDPVAVDQACLDLIAQAENNTNFLNRVNRQNGYHTLEHAAQIGLGSREYRLVDIDNEPAPRPQANMTYADGVLTISNLEDSAKLIHASYTNGALSGLEITDAANGTMNVETKSGDKFMLWSTIGEMIPISSAVTVETGTITEPEPTGNKTLVAYFSATNNTEGVAKHIADVLGVDIYEIMPVEPYTAADLDYHTDCRASREQRDASARPAISGEAPDIEQYDTIFLGYPIWGGNAPKIIYTFLEKYDFAGKTIIPFCTSNSSGIGESAKNMYSLVNGAEWLDGHRFAGGASKDSVKEWIDGLGLDFGNSEEVSKMKVQIGNAVFTATLEDNTAAREFVAMMKEAPVTINMSDYSGFEKVCSLGRNLTANNSQMTTVPGDIVLYSGNQIVMFYGSNSWSYTKLGHIDDLTGWEAALGSGNITAVFSVAE